ncbi:MAG: RNA polymerase sigma factor [Clostridia bacterium]|nr:RNA polymerase sigma factor [Clostridia bacterium]
MTDTERIRLAEAYGQEYMGKIFYYCLRKTGDSHEAEELASDITYQILTALHEGVDVLNFPAWVWQIARNRYALWAKTKHRRGEYESFIDPDDPETENLLTAGGYNTTPSVADEYAHDEEMAILRRELAFLGRDYREVVVAYYIEDRSVGDIARALGQPEGTVKSRLFRSRNLLKEGMNMAREFGSKSYKPEEVRFVSSGSQASGLPFSAVRRMLPKNILLEASNNLSTAEELSVAVGVAMPYMEEEIAALVDAGLLKAVGNRYITNFFIESHDLQVAIRNEIMLLTRDWAERYDELMDKSIPIYRKGCFVPETMTDGELKWYLVLELLDQLVRNCKGHTYEFPVKHKHPNDSWGFIGYEGEGIEEEWFVGQTGSLDGGTAFWSYQIGKWNMWNRAATWNTPAIKLIGEMLREDRRVDTLTPTEKEIFDRRNPYTFSIDEEGRVIPNIITFRGDEKEAIREKIAALPECAALQEATQAVFERMVSLLRREGHAVLEDQLPYCASSSMCKCRGILLDSMVDKGILTIPAEPAISTVAMELIVK